MVIEWSLLDCKTAVFFANASDGPYSRVKNGEGEWRVRLARFTLEDHAYGASSRKRLFCSLGLCDNLKVCKQCVHFSAHEQ